MKVVVAEFTTEDMETVEAHLKQELDLELGKLILEQNYAKKTVETQIYLDEELSDNQGVIDLLATDSHIALAELLSDGVIRNYEGLSVCDISEGKFVTLAKEYL